MKYTRSGLPDEELEQRAVKHYLDITVGKYGYFAVPNGGKRSRIEAAIFSGLGVKAGVPDLIITARAPNYPDARGVAIEMKIRKGGRVSPEQAEWLAALTSQGWQCNVCHGADEAIEFLKSLGYGRR